MHRLHDINNVVNLRCYYLKMKIESYFGNLKFHENQIGVIYLIRGANFVYYVISSNLLQLLNPHFENILKAKTEHFSLFNNVNTNLVIIYKYYFIYYNYYSNSQV